jgi:cell division protein FtsN
MASGNIKKFELKLGRAGLVIIIAGMVVLLCVFFLIGVHVGKDIDANPEKISSLPKRVLALFWKPAKVSISPPVREVRETEHDPVESSDLAFYNHPTDSKAKTQDDQVAVPKKPQDGFLPDAPVPAQVFPPVPEQVKPPEEESVKPALEDTRKEDVSRTAKKTVQKPVASKPEFIVHVASFKERKRAFEVLKTVADMKYSSSRVVQVEIQGKGTWYRVVVSGFDTQAKAQAAADKISKKVNAKGIVRRVETGEKRN